MSSEGVTMKKSQHSTSNGRKNTIDPSDKQSKVRLLPPGYQPTIYDVVCGRGKGTYLQPGNERFRAIVATHAASYDAINTKAGKMNAVNRIIEVVKSDSNGSANFILENGDGMWEELDLARVRDKVGHAIREALGRRWKIGKDSHDSNDLQAAQAMAGLAKKVKKNKTIRKYETVRKRETKQKKERQPSSSVYRDEDEEDDHYPVENVTQPKNTSQNSMYERLSTSTNTYAGSEDKKRSTLVRESEIPIPDEISSLRRMQQTPYYVNNINNNVINTHSPSESSNNVVPNRTTASIQNQPSTIPGCTFAPFLVANQHPGARYPFVLCLVPVRPTILPTQQHHAMYPINAGNNHNTVRHAQQHGDEIIPPIHRSS